MRIFFFNENPKTWRNRSHVQITHLQEKKEEKKNENIKINKKNSSRKYRITLKESLVTWIQKKTKNAIQLQGAKVWWLINANVFKKRLRSAMCFATSLNKYQNYLPFTFRHSLPSKQILFGCSHVVYRINFSTLSSSSSAAPEKPNATVQLKLTAAKCWQFVFITSSLFSQTQQQQVCMWMDIRAIQWR